MNEIRVKIPFSKINADERPLFNKKAREFVIRWLK
jgi:hypothetical protein